MKRIWKRVMGMLLALLMLMSLLPAALAANNEPGVEYGYLTAVQTLGNVKPSMNFKDVKKSDWYYATMDRLVRAGGINGYEDGTFRPNGGLKKCEFVKMLVAIMFPDYVSMWDGCAIEGKETWYAPYVGVANYLGLMRDIPGDTIAALEAPITRYEMASIIMYAAWAMNQGLEDSDTIKYIIGDYQQIPNHYKEAVRRAYQNGILTGKTNVGDFCGSDGLTRAEACTVIVRLYEDSARVGTYYEMWDVSNSCTVTVAMPIDWEDTVFSSDTGYAGNLDLAYYCAATGGLLFRVFVCDEPRQFPSRYQEIGVVGTEYETHYLYLVYPGGVEYNPNDTANAAIHTKMIKDMDNGKVRVLAVME